jgi:GR25 family glycosyltransferase involved in LPS biosynthesis
MTVSGELYSPTNQTADLLLFGPYGNEWKTAPSHLPRIYFSAENWPVEEDPSIALYLTPSRKEDATHLRVPTWATFIDWFSGQTVIPKEGSDNPIRLPLHLAMTPNVVPFSQRPEFCGFVVSNPVCEFRNQTFLAVNEYKKVNSGGGLFNNIGERLELKYPGGGCGDISKHHFFAKHQFTISFENSQSSGYITEKVLHAKMAGCLPLYWGDQDTDLDFAPHSLINLSAIQNDPQRVVQLLKKLEENPSLCEKMAFTPILNEEKKEKALQQMSLVCKRLMDLACVKPHKEPVERIYVINLPHREDRWATFQASQPAWNPARVERVRAVDGKKLQLNQTIYQLFEHNEFQWKKSVMGCSMSHLSVWTSIQSRTTDPEDAWYLILEDDVRFQSDGWSLFTNTLSKEIPSDADVLYLGGVLPPNQPALPLALEPVTTHWSRIKPNRFFSTVPAPFFHFCAYSYLLTKKGARKLLQGVLQSKRKAYTGIDHLINHPQYGLSVYIATPLITSCFQEEDPAYVQSNFNDLARKDQFDSDIWNNTECFTEKDLAPFQCQQKKESFTVYYEPSADGSPFELYERKWLEFLFEKEITFEPYHEPVRDAWYLVQRPHSEKWNQRFAEFHRQGSPFRVLHLSDEFLSDTIDFYWLPECKAVIRNYPREMSSRPHILTIPLGYHHVPSVESQNRTFREREWIWSFHGTDWFRRGQQLEAFRSFVPHRCHLQPEWNHSTMTKESQYLSHLTNSKFCPILKGNHYETFRLYEALEAGVIPVTTITDMSYLSWVDEHLHLEELYPWNKPLVMLKRSEEELESLRQSIRERWTAWKKKIQSEVRLLF